MYCFFEDLHKIQDFLGETWTSYKNQEIGLTAASFTTTAAIDIVRREGEKLAHKIFPGQEGVSWWNLVALISEKEYVETNTGLFTESLHRSSHGRFIYASPALLLFRLWRHFVQTDDEVSCYFVKDIRFVSLANTIYSPLEYSHHYSITTR